MEEFMPKHIEPQRTSWWERIKAIVSPARTADLTALDPDEIGKMARDLRISGEELADLARRPSDSAKLLHRRLSSLGMDEQRVDVAVLRDMERCCSCCDSKEQCEQDLKAEPGSKATPSYCPNQQTLEALGSMKCH
jgi:hypothetical protein